MTGVQSDTGVLAGDERMLIDGELRHTDSGATFDVIHPASEDVAGQATDGTVEDMRRAVGAARRAFDETDWSRGALAICPTRNVYTTYFDTVGQSRRWRGGHRDTRDAASR